MTIQEFFEAAQLDALGLLEQDELERFESAMASAPAPLQAQLRAEQDRWVQMNLEARDVEAPSYLRDKVLASIEVSRGVQDAEIAEAVAAMRDRVLTRLSHEMHMVTDPSVLHQDQDDAHPDDLLTPTEEDVLHLHQGRRVAPLWRAASIGFALAATLTLVSFLYVSERNRDLVKQFETLTVEEGMLRSFPTTILNDVLFDPDTRHVVFVPAAQSPAAVGDLADQKVALFLNPKWQASRLFCGKLPDRSGESYRVVILNNDNEIVEEIKDFKSNGAMMSESLSFRLGQGTRLAIATARIGQKATEAGILMIATITPTRA